MTLTLISERQLAEKLGYKYSSLRTLMCRKPENFPPARMLRGRKVWVESEVDDWIRENVSVAGI